MSRGDRFEKADFDLRYRPDTKQPSNERSRPSKLTIWPVESPEIGQSVMADRDGRGTPHRGIDLFVPAGSPVRSTISGTVLRVIDGRGAAKESLRKAGLFVDLMGDDKLVYRFLHLGAASVTANQRVQPGEQLGTVAPPNTSGTGPRSHLHFEIRTSDWGRGGYGRELDPLRMIKDSPTK